MTDNYARGYGMLSQAVRIAIDMLARQQPPQTVEAALRTALEQTEKTVRTTEVK
jgi:hypothetical protein